MKTKTNPWSSKTSLLTDAAAIFAAAFLLSAGSAQAATNNAVPQLANRIEKSDIRAADKSAGDQKAKEQTPAKTEVASADASPQPQAVTVTTYPFTSASGVALEDMSSGTTTLVAAGLDDNASAVVNVGFDFWYDGVRFTQFSVNANGLARLGGAVVSTSFDNGSGSSGFATTTNAPKIAPYYDDLWIGTNGKIHFKVIGSAPSRKLIVEWQNMTIPRPGAATTGAGTFQMWLFETSGVIEFVYGSGIILNSANGGYSVGLQSGAATNFASVTTTTPSVSYAAANNTQSNAIAATTAYLFTPNTPATPTGLNFTAVTATGMTLNWTDVATNEFGYAIYRSLDGTNYTFVSQTAANAVLFNDTGLTPSTTYFYKVYAVTEGALSTALTGSQATAAPGNITSNGTGGGLWGSTTTWSGGSVPTAGDNVTILSGDTVVINSSNALNLTVQSGGILEFETTLARTLTVGQSVTIDSGGTFRTAATGTVVTHVLSVGTNLTNNGTLDFSTNANTAGAGITFTGAANNTFDGTGGTTDIRTITINKGATNSNVLELKPDNFTVRGATTDSATANYLTLTNGTFKISGTFTAAFRTFPAATYVIPATGGIWLNNPNYTIVATASSTTTLNNGLLRMTQGTYNIGIGAGDGMDAGSGAVFTIEGGTLNVSGALDPQGNVTYAQSAGAVNVGGVGNTRSNFGTFELFGATSVFNMSGGTITLIQPCTGGTQVDWRVNGTTTVTGGLVTFGTAATAGTRVFNVRANLPNFEVDNTTNAKTVTATAQINLLGTTTIKAGSTMIINGQLCLVLGPTFTNNGTLTGTAASTRFYFLGGLGASTYTGTGVVTAPLLAFEVDNTAGVTINPVTTNQIIAATCNIFSGGLTGSGKLTLGNGAATTATVQLGVGSPVAAVTGFDVPPVFNPGTGGVRIFYAPELTARTTGNEMPPSRTLSLLNVTNTNGITIAGGDVTVNGAGAGALTMTNAPVATGANTLYFNTATGTVVRTLNGYVIGNFKKSYAAIASKSFEVGTANGFSPVTVNATAGSFPTDFTVKAIQGAAPYVSGTNKLARYWTLTGSGITANLTFTYLATDVTGTPASYKFIKNSAGTISILTPDAPPTTTSATISGVTSFSDWTLAEPASVTPGSLQFSASNYNDNETNADHTATITVTRTGGTDGAVSVHYATTDGSATLADNDYATASGDLNWAAGDATDQTFTVTVKGDTTFEGNDTVNLTLSAATGGAAIGSPNPATLTILNDDPNTPPSIAAVGVTRQQGTAVSNSTIATVNDTESGPGAVVVTVTSANPSNGVTISNIVNTAGTVTADVVASCSATNANFTLQASDGNLTTTDTLTVTVTANPAPTLTYNNASVPVNGSTTVNPATGPTDNGSVSTIVVLSPGTYTGTISVDNGTGIVSVSNAAPIGSHTITIRATDNCGVTTDATFTLTVDAPVCVAPSTVYVNANWVGTPPGTDPDGAGPATNFGCDSFATIQDGVDGVTAGGSVIVAAGTYTEQVSVNKNLTLTGAGAATTIIQAPGVMANDPDGAKTIVLFTGVVTDEISGFTIQGPVNGINFGIYARAGATVNIHDNTIKDIRDNPLSGNQNGYGIEIGKYNNTFPNVDQIGHATITNNLVIGYQKTGIECEGASSTATITGNTVTGAGLIPTNAQNGIQIRRGATGTIDTNTVTGNAWTGHSNNAAGIIVTYPGPGVIIQNNIVNNNTSNIYTYEADGVQILNNQLTDQTDGRVMAGITADSDNVATASVGITVTITGNTVKNNLSGGSHQGPGIFLWGVKSGTVSGNTIAGNGDDGLLIGASGNITITSNVFRGNGFNTFFSVDPNAAAIDFGGVIPELEGFGVQPNTLGGFSVHHNVIVGNKNGVWSYDSASTDVENNWWGCNAGPGLTGCDATGGNVDFDPWIVLQISASPNPIVQGGTSTVTADMTHNSDNAVPSGTLPQMDVAFTALEGTMNPTSGTITSGQATSLFTSTSANDGSASATVDNQSVKTIITVLSSNADLSNLTLSAGTLTPAFASNTTSYTASVPYSTTSITETPTAADANATITVNGNAVASGTPSGAIALAVGPNVITTVVTAEDNTTTKTYTVTVSRAAASSNADLSNLTLSAGTLTPAFASNTTSYTANVSNATTSITETPTAADANATITVNGNPVASGTPSGAIALAVGPNVITTVVTAQDSSTKTYTVTVTRDVAPPPIVYVDDNWVGTTPGTDPDGGAGPASNFGFDAFATIQDGVNGVANPGTVIVYAGTYPEAVTVDKSLTILGAQAGQNANTRFAAFVSGPNGPKANPAVESILTAAATAPTSGANDTLHIMANNVTFDGFVVDGNNPALAQGGAVLVGGINTDSRTGIQTEDAAGNNFPANGVTVQFNVIQNFAGDNGNNLGGGVTLINGTASNTAPATTGNLITRNVVRNFGAYGILLSYNAYADVTFNTVDMPDYPTANAGIWVYDFLNTGTPHTTNITNNDVTVGQDNFGGIWINLAYLAAINIDNNTVHAAASVVSGSDYNYGIYLTSLRPGTTASLSGNIVGASGGQFDRGIALWNVGTSPTTTTVKNGSVKNSVDGISLIYNDANFGPALSSSAANVSGMTVSGSQVGVVVDASSSGSNSVTMTVTNSTLSGNTAASGGAFYSVGTGGIATTTITNSTLSENSPGGTSIFLQDASLTVGNSIFNPGNSGINISSNGASTVTSRGYNLSRDNFSNLNLGSSFLTNTGDQINTDPMLGPLKDNGGPTFTHAPLNGSTAIDKGKDIGPVGPAYAATGEDQRGSSRPITYDASIVAPSGGDRSDIGSVELAPGVKPQSAASWKLHGPAGYFPINLPLSGPVGIECRTGATSGEYQVIVTFAQPITFSSADVTSGTGSVSGTSLSRPKAGKFAGPSGTQVTIDLTGVTNAQTIVIALFDVDDGVNSGDVGIRMGMLLGDVNGVGGVTGADVNDCKARVGATLSPTNFRNDVDTTGSITGSDVNVIKSKVGTVLPP